MSTSGMKNRKKTIQSIYIKKIIREYKEKLITINLQIKMNKQIPKKKKTQVTKTQKIEKWNKSIPIKINESIFQNFPQQNFQAQMFSIAN